MNRPGHKDDFNALYNLSDPGPYFRGLDPADYRLPDVLSSLFRSRGQALLDARGHSGPLRMIDFACGYGAIGAVLRFETDMRGLFRKHGAEDAVREGRGHWEEDRAAFQTIRRDLSIEVEIAGLDIADEALRYARFIGAIDRDFAENLVSEQPSPALLDYARTADLIIESGALGDAFAPAFEKLLHVPAPPWILFSPRPDFDMRAARSTLASFGYRIEVFASSIAYRRCLSEREEREFVDLSTSLGLSADKVLSGGYMRVDILLCRPDAEASAIPISSLIGDWRDDGPDI